MYKETWFLFTQERYIMHWDPDRADLSSGKFAEVKLAKIVCINEIIAFKGQS